jgi:transposase
MSTCLELSNDEKHRLRLLMRQADLHPKVRERAEALLLLAAGWTEAAVATHVERCERTVQRWLEAYRTGGDAGLRPQRPGPEPADRSGLDEAVRGLLEQPRTWTIRQLGEALAATGRPTSRRQVRAALERLGARWVRTHHTLSHRQDPAAVSAAKEALETLKKGL